MRNIFRISFITFYLFAFASCEQSISLEEVNDVNVSTRSAKELSFFKDVERIESPSTGEVYISGNIYCTEKATYTFIFSFQGNEGTGYDAWIGHYHIAPSNGGNFREITLTLEPGMHKCNLQIYFTGENQQADARIAITKINGSSAGTGEGHSDLVAQGTSKKQTLVETEEMHWTCPKCHFTLNGIGNDTCMSCGETREESENSNK